MMFGKHSEIFKANPIFVTSTLKTFNKSSVAVDEYILLKLLGNFLLGEID